MQSSPASLHSSYGRRRHTRASSSNSASSQRSSFSLHDSFGHQIDDSPNNSFGSSSFSGGGGGGHGKGLSLAHELVSAFDEKPGSGRAGRVGMSLAEEFGFFDEEDGLDQPSSPNISATSSHFHDDNDDLLFAQPSRHSDELDSLDDPHFAQHDSHFNFDPHTLELDDIGRLADERAEALESEGLETTPTRHQQSRKSSHQGAGFSSIQHNLTSSSSQSPITRLDSAHPSSSSSPSRSSFHRQPNPLNPHDDLPPSDNDSDGFETRHNPHTNHSRSRQQSSSTSPSHRLFSSNPSSSQPFSSTSHHRQPHQPSSPELDLTPSTLLPLLSLKDDRSFEVERGMTTFLTQMDESSRKREAMERELGMLEMEVKRFVADGGGFESEEEDLADDESGSEGGDGHGGLGHILEEERSFDRSFTSSSGLPATPTSNHFHSSVDFRSPANHNDSTSSNRLDRSFDPTSSYLPQTHRISKRQKSFSPAGLLLPSLSDLTSLTTSLLSSLSSLKDTSQINLSSSADLGRRLRALRGTFGSLKVEEDGLEKARKEIEKFEEDRMWSGEEMMEEGGIDKGAEEMRKEDVEGAEAESEGQTEEGGGRVRKDLKGLVEKEMEGFKEALDLFEARTRSVRDEHQAWLANAA